MTLRMVPAEDIRPGMRISLPRYFQTVTVVDVTPWVWTGKPWDPVLLFTVDPPRMLPGLKSQSTVLPACAGEQFIVREED